MNETTHDPKVSHVTKQERLSFGTEISLSLFFVRFLLHFQHFFRLAKMASTLSIRSSSHATIRYSTEQTVSMVMDYRSPNVLTADSECLI